MKRFLLIMSLMLFAACSQIVDPDKDSLGERPSLDAGEAGKVVGCQTNADCQTPCEDFSSFFCDTVKGFCGCANAITNPPPRSSCTTTSSGGEFDGQLCSCPDDFEASCIGTQCTCTRTNTVEVLVDSGTRIVYVDAGREIVYIYPDAGLNPPDTGPPDTGPPQDAGMDSSHDILDASDEDSGGEDAQVTDAGSDAGSDPTLCSVQAPCLMGNFFGLKGSANVPLGTANTFMGAIEFKVTDEDFLITTLSVASDLAGDIDVPQDTSATLVVRLQYRNSSGQLQVVSMPLVGGKATFTGLDFPVRKAQVRALAQVYVDFTTSVPSIGQQLRLGLLEKQSADSFYAVSMSGDEAVSWFTSESAIGDPPTLYTLTP